MFGSSIALKEQANVSRSLHTIQNVALGFRNYLSCTGGWTTAWLGNMYLKFGNWQYSSNEGKTYYEMKWKNVFWVKTSCPRITSTLSLAEQIRFEFCNANWCFGAYSLPFLQIGSSKEVWRTFSDLYYKVVFP